MPQFTAGRLGAASICDDFVLQYELRIKYSPVAGATKAGFSIEEATLDLVYGTVSGAAEVTIPRVSSVSFFQSESSRRSSGTPGYIKAYPLRTATRVPDAEGPDSMEELQDGMYIRGADNSGQCIELDGASVQGETAEQAFKRQYPAHRYTEDPRFTFEDSIMYGCHKDMTFAELKSYCENAEYENLLIFQYLSHSLSHLGKFGNSDPHFVSDWVEVQQEERGRPDAGTFDDDLGVCETMSPSILINIYYQKIGRVDQHQHEIVNATMRRSDEYSVWKFDKPNKTDRQRFTAMVNVEFYELDRGTEFFVPKTPDIVQPVGLNFLYPFQRLSPDAGDQ